MSKKKSIVFYFFLLLPVTGYSQYIIIKDIDTHSPLSGVNIYSDDYGTTTDSIGVSNLLIFDDEDEITISHIGYTIIKKRKLNLENIILLKRSNISITGVSVISFKSKRERKRYTKLERDVIRVYPYAVLVGKLLIEYSSVMDSINELSYLKKRKEKKRIFTLIENKLLKKYGNRVKRLSRNQGRILIRLVDRETRYTSHKIIRDFRGFFVAGFWQITAILFGHNLKTEFNSEIGEDKLIEHIIVNKIIK